MSEYKYINFMNKRGSVKLSVWVEKPLKSLADITDRQADLINYICSKGYNFNLAYTADKNALALNESVFDMRFIGAVSTNKI